MALALALILLVIGTVLFHFFSPWWFTPIASNWQMMDDTVHVTFWVTGIVFVAVNLFLAYAVIRYRHRKDRPRKAQYEPENRKLEWWLTIVTSVGIAAMLAPGLSVWAKFVTVPDDASVVEVLGQQWNWAYRFPGRDAALGRSDIRFVTADNPFGLDPQDPAGQDDVLAASAELHLPLDRPVKVLLRSRDVNHQFAVPQFRVKMDMVPGMVTYFWFTPTRTGSFDVLCEQLCGVAHFAMRGRVVVDEQHTFGDWLAAQPTFAQSQAAIAGDIQAGQTLYTPCAACHGTHAQGNRALNAPKLSGQGKWYLAKQLQSFRNGVRGAHEGDTYGQQMAAIAGTLPDDAAVRNVVAYIDSLEEVRPDSTVLGNPARGQSLYATCASCHGTQAQGVWSTQAPRLSNMSDWYLQRQIHNFRAGIRGTHAQDFAGAQMASIARLLSDDEDVNDVLDYVHTL